MDLDKLPLTSVSAMAAAEYELTDSNSRQLLNIDSAKLTLIIVTAPSRGTLAAIL